LVTIDEIKQIAQLNHNEKMLEEARNYPYVGHVLRRVSPYLTKLFVESKVSANQVTSLSILFGIAGDLSFVFGNYSLMALGCIVFHQLWNLFDCVDGEVARVTTDITLGGRFLESVHNPIIQPGFMACFGVGLFRISDNIIFLYFGFIFALSVSLFYSFRRSRQLVTESIGREDLYRSPWLKRQSLAGRFYRSLYSKISLLFLLPNTYLIIAGILVFERFSPVEFSYLLYGVTLDVLSAYFFLCGFYWLVRTIVSGATNYRYLGRMQERL